MKEYLPEIITFILGGGALKFVEHFFMKPSEKKATQNEFIETLLGRVSYLEGKIDNMSAQLYEIIKENERLKAELDHLIKCNNDKNDDA